MSDHSRKDMLLFWGCFIALIATAFGFIVRAQIIGDWGQEFGLTQTQQGEIFGVGLWPFAISIVLFSLFIDRVGYKTAMIFGFACHLLSVVLTVTATGYWSLWLATFIVALGNGTVEAYINPVVATMFSKEKTKWLNILHAGWPGGLVIGGILAISLGDIGWRWKVALLLLPTVIYFVMLIGSKFPVQERVKAGVSYLDMLREFGGGGALIVSWMIIAELGRVIAGLIGQGEALSHLPVNWIWIAFIISLVIGVGFGAAVKSAGRPLFILLLVVMIPLATTELGTDSWITELMKPEMVKLGIDAGWVLVYTSLIMTVLRFFAGPLIHRLSPLGLLGVCSVLAIVGLVFLSKATGITILLAATLYGVGKTFFWPTMLGVVSEQFPKGGALTLNAAGAVGMLGVGVLGAQFLGFFQDKNIESTLEERDQVVYEQVLGEKPGLFGAYKAVDPTKVEELDQTQKALVTEVQDASKKNTLMAVAIFPIIMLVCYILMFLYFKARGGYKPVELAEGGGGGGH